MSTSVRHRGFVLISGSSTGIGYACALHLAAIGFHVFAGVRKDADGQSLEQAAHESVDREGSLRAISLDVTNADSVASAARIVKDAAGAEGLAGLINNAGISIPGPVESVSMESWRRQFEVNFFGHIALTQATLPLLRDHVMSHGKGRARIVMMSSIAGRIAQPIVGPYNASKFAMEAMSDALRMEVRPQGIRVCVVEPGAIATPIWVKGEANNDLMPKDSRSRELYGHAIDGIIAAARKAAAGAVPPQRVAKVVAHCLTSRWPRTRYLVGTDAHAGAWAKTLLPTRLLDAGMCSALDIPRR